jgi:SPP1 gp7 family putative phage head morphogenesis protein
MDAVFLLALRNKRAGIRNRRARRARLPHTKYPWAVERRYALTIYSYVARLARYVREILEARESVYGRADGANIFRVDVDPLALELIALFLDGWASVAVPDASIELGVANTGEAVKSAADKSFGAQTESLLGFPWETAEGPWWPGTKSVWAANNLQLIKSLEAAYIEQVNRLVEEAVTNGWRYEDLLKKIQALGGWTNKPSGWIEKRSKLIARDQIGKLNGRINRAQQEAVGVSTYFWETAGDERVRGSHRGLDGKLCRWDAPNIYSPDAGKTWIARPASWFHGHPGEDIQCRCTALPNFDPIIQTIDAELAKR